MRNTQHHTACNRQSTAREHRSTSKSRGAAAASSEKICESLKSRTKKSDLPRTAKLLENLERGMTPNFLDIMASISEFVAFYTEYDTDAEYELDALLKMSGKKCRNCS